MRVNSYFLLPRVTEEGYVVLKSQIEIEEDIASFGLVYMAKIG